MPSQRTLTQTLVELADNLVADFDVIDLLTILAERCCDALAVTDAGIMLAAPLGGDLRVMASSSTAMRDLEIYELQASEGPCLDCYRSGEPVTNQDLTTTQQKWPKFTDAAVTAGYRTATAIPLRLRANTIGALNLFRTARGRIGDDDLRAAQAFADVATIAILQHRATIDAQALNEQLNQALNARISIEQAKGMLAERASIGVDEAFLRLRQHARNHNLRLVALAQNLVAGAVSLDAIGPITSKPRH